MNWLKTFRIKNNVTQSELARRTGYPQGSISKIESGKLEPNLTLLIALVKHYNFDVNQFLKER